VKRSHGTSCHDQAAIRGARECRDGPLDLGRVVHIDPRWVAGDAERFRRYAAELVALAPDVILALAAQA